jgi:hypothetical protein
MWVSVMSEMFAPGKGVVKGVGERRQLLRLGLDNLGGLNRIF